MLTLYHQPLSPVSRRVWWALLEKQLAFTPVVVKLTGEQHRPEFLALNPFHQVPVLVDGALRLVESLAILDYLEYAYPQQPLTPVAPVAYGQMKMVELVITTQLMPKLLATAAASTTAAGLARAQTDLAVPLAFLERTLGQDLYFAGAHLSLADVVAGCAIPLFVHLGVSLETYPALTRWHQRIIARPHWQHTQPSPAALRLWRQFVTRSRSLPPSP